MAKRLPERYNPGDLSRTRSNLGELTREEANRMAEILGGEIGIEKADDALRQKYERIRKKNEAKGRPPRRNRDTGHPKGKNQDSSIDYNQINDSLRNNSAYTGHYSHKKRKSKKIKYLDRIKIDLIASKPEHRVKTRASIIYTYFSFLIKNKDTVNPEFIIEGDRFYYNHIEELVTKLKALKKMIKPSIFKNYINLFYRDIIKILLSWDLKEMSRDMSYLQKSPRGRDIKECAELCRLIYIPIFKLINTDLKLIYAAVDRLYRVLIIVYHDDPDQLTNIKNQYLDVKEKIKVVYKDVSYTCYPLLLKLTGERFYYFREFLQKDLKNILEFLKLDMDDLIVPPENINELGKNQYSLNHLKKKIEKEEHLNIMQTSENDRNQEEVKNIPELLEKLFPESKWSEFEKFPDLFPYFHPLFKFPKGTELIAAEDPIQQIIVLAAIIQDLLYGFRSIKILTDQKELIESTTDKWHLFIDDMIQKNYTKILVEYCRNIDKSIDFAAGKFGQKLITDIYWFKRRFILPFLKLKILYKPASVPIKAPKFHVQVNKFYTALAELMESLDKSNDRQEIIENYDKTFHFEIKNITSYRLKKILEQENIAPTNENLIRYTMMLVSFLDFLINSSRSPYYINPAEEMPVYRYDPVFNGKPQYSVSLLDTYAILKKY